MLEEKERKGKERKRTRESRQRKEMIEKKGANAVRGRRGKRGEKENTGQEERRKEDEEEKETSRSRCRAGGEKVKAVTGERGKAVVMVTKKMRKQEWKKKVMKRGRSFEKVCG